MEAQYLFNNCTIIDGAGSASWVGAVAVDQGRILALGPDLGSISAGGGIDLVMVNGEVAYREGIPTGVLAGRLLKLRTG